MAKRLVPLLVGLSIFAPPVAHAQLEPQGRAYSMLQLGYAQPASDSDLDAGMDSVLGLGQRRGYYAYEASLHWAEFEGADYLGGLLHGLWFPGGRDGRLYLALGLGAMEVASAGAYETSFSAVAAEVGVGYQWALGDRNRWSLRLDARYRRLHRNEQLNTQREDIAAPRQLEDTRFSIGMQYALTPLPPAPPAEPAMPAVDIVPANANGSKS